MTNESRVTQREMYKALIDMRNERDAAHENLLQKLSLLARDVQTVGQKVETIQEAIFANNGKKGILANVNYLMDKEKEREVQKATIFVTAKVIRWVLWVGVPTAAAVAGWMYARVKL